MKRYLDLLKKTGKFLPKKKYILLFSGGFLIASLWYFYSEDKYEKEIFSAMAGEVYTQAGPFQHNDDTLLIKALHLTHYLAAPRLEIFGNKEFNSMQPGIIHPVTFDLLTAKGACGSFSYILSRLLEEMNISTRIAQMKSNGLYGAHMVVEAKTANGWVVLDPIFDQYFIKPDGSLASFDDVKTNWNEYARQVSSDYDLTYRYEGARYTNWTKIPVIMPAIKQVMYWTIGKEKTDGFSLRSLFLRKYHVLFLITLTLLILQALVIMKMYIRKKQFRITLHELTWSDKRKHAPFPA